MVVNGFGATIMSTNFDGATASGTQLTGVTWSQDSGFDSVVTPSTTFDSLTTHNLRNDLGQWQTNVVVDYNLNTDRAVERGIKTTFSISGADNVTLTAIKIGSTHTTSSGGFQAFTSDHKIVITDTSDDSVVWTNTTNYNYGTLKWQLNPYDLTAAPPQLLTGKTYSISLSMANMPGGGAYATWNELTLEGYSAVVANDDDYIAPLAVALTGDVTENDETSAALYTHIVGATPERLTFNTDGTFSYNTPSTSVPSVTFTYEITDNAVKGSGNQLDTAVVTITNGSRVNFWRFENDLTDEEGSSDGVVVGSPSYTTGKLGNAVALDGTVYIDANSITLPTAFSVTGYMYRADTTNRALFTYRTAGNGELFKLLTIENGTKLRVYGGSVGTIDTPELPAMALHEWQQFAVTLGDGELKIYLNGSLVHTANKTGNWSGANVFRIGSNGSGGQIMNGALDEIKVYNYKMTDNEVLNDTTPVLGLEVVQDEQNLNWTVAEEIGVKEYQVIDATTGEVIETIIADGSDQYSAVIPEGTEVKLVVVDISGVTQSFYPENTNEQVTVYTLTKGWNLIATTGDNADFSDVETLWGWNGSGYEVVSNPEATRAVWVYSESDKDKELVVKSEKSDVVIALNTGWNMVGPTKNCEAPESAQSIYTWTTKYNEVLSETNILIEGVGYWIFSLK